MHSCTVFRRDPCAKMYTRGCTRGCHPLVAGFEGVQFLAFIITLVWLLCVHKLHQFATLGGGQRPCTAASQLCTLCAHAVIANLVDPIKLGGSARIRRQCPGVGVVSCNQRLLMGSSQP